MSGEGKYLFGIGGAAGWMERKGTCLGRCEAGALLVLTWMLDVPAGVSWDQSEDNLEISVVSGITLCGSGFCLWWSVLAGCS